MTDPAQAFINNLRILHSIDLHELQSAGIFPEGLRPIVNANNYDWHKWEDFRDSPYTEVMKWDDDKVAALWEIIKARGGG